MQHTRLACAVLRDVQAVQSLGGVVLKYVREWQLTAFAWESVSLPSGYLVQRHTTHCTCIGWSLLCFLGTCQEPTQIIAVVLLIFERAYNARDTLLRRAKHTSVACVSAEATTRLGACGDFMNALFDGTGQ